MTPAVPPSAALIAARDNFERYIGEITAGTSELVRNDYRRELDAIVEAAALAAVTDTSYQEGFDAGRASVVLPAVPLEGD